MYSRKWSHSSHISSHFHEARSTNNSFVHFQLDSARLNSTVISNLLSHSEKYFCLLSFPLFYCSFSASIVSLQLNYFAFLPYWIPPSHHCFTTTSSMTNLRPLQHFLHDRCSTKLLPDYPNIDSPTLVTLLQQYPLCRSSRHLGEKMFRPPDLELLVDTNQCKSYQFPLKYKNFYFVTSTNGIQS